MVKMPQPGLRRGAVALSCGVIAVLLSSCQTAEYRSSNAAMTHETQEQSQLPQPSLNNSTPQPTINNEPEPHLSANPQVSAPTLDQSQIKQKLEPGFYSFPIYDGNLDCEIGTGGATFADCWAHFTTTWKEQQGEHRQVNHIQFLTEPADIAVSGTDTPPPHDYAPVSASGPIQIGDVLVNWPDANQITMTRDNTHIYTVGPDYYTVVAH
ncbi:hypothetical protein GSS88_06345 [Corynebacterium sp. 3HC-13]|uniref:hypothetical protein n=1 Tax=Corynebacterium poyangense TaxID=2684405 RepID=UPI001CCF2C4D|nr:hypothetical protein [Corynebacterium poyangense]MBZ8177417.1 hypothetical protein [Corynebacterium poyangense]